MRFKQDLVSALVADPPCYLFYLLLCKLDIMLLIPAGVLCFKFSQEKYISGVVSLFKRILSAILLHTAWTYLFPNNFGMFQTSKHFLCKHFYENTLKCSQIILEYFDYSEYFELFSNNFRIYETFIAIWIVWQTFFV